MRENETAQSIRRIALILSLVALLSLVAAGTVGMTVGATSTTQSADSTGFLVEITETNTPVETGQQLSVDAEITNNGVDGQWQLIYLRDDGDVVAQEWVWLWEDQSKTVSFSWDTTGADADVEEISVTSDDDTDTQDVTIDGPAVEPPGFLVNITETNGLVTDSEVFSVDAEITNDGGDDQWQLIYLRDDGNIVAQEWVWLREGASKTVSLSWDDPHTSLEEISVTSDDDTDTQEVTTCSADGVDSDEDGLADCIEQTHGTDPNVADTDGDGLTDGQEVHNDMLSDGDPLRQDIFVEVDYRGGDKNEIKDALNPVIDQFAEAPIENPDGTSGIDLHIVMDDELSTDTELDIGDHTPSYRDYRDSGYHVMAVDLTGAETSYASYGRGVVHANSANEGMAKVFMHEFGHSLGLGVGAYHGIDSADVSAEKYPSIMNYNYHEFQFNTGEPHDDWEFIENGYTPTVGGGGCTPDSTGFWCPL